MGELNITVEFSMNVILYCIVIVIQAIGQEICVLLCNIINSKL